MHFFESKMISYSKKVKKFLFWLILGLKYKYNESLLKKSKI